MGTYSLLYLDPSYYESDAFAEDIFMLPGVPPWIMATLLAVRSMLHATLIQEKYLNKKGLTDKRSPVTSHVHTNTCKF